MICANLQTFPDISSEFSVNVFNITKGQRMVIKKLPKMVVFAS